MEKEKKYFVNGTLLLFALVYFAFLSAVSIALASIGRYFSAVVFGILALLFLAMGFRYGSVVRVGKGGVELKFLWMRRRFLLWSEVAEVLVAGTKVMNRGNTKKCGTLYMVFSPVEMDDDERFQTMLHWPPKDKIFLKFTKDRLMDIQWF
ncbi:MAG: hypothetical protein ACI4S4_04770, partial [Candidatus Ornithospirochaeta sp.]